LTQDRLLELIHEAAKPDITSSADLERNLQILIDTQGINLGYFVPEDQRDYIIEHAPSMIQIGENSLIEVTYSNHQPFVRQQDWKPEDIAGLEGEIYLADGRQVFFMFDRKRRTVLELQGKLLALV
ncbi:MAG: hypothetical protein JWP13_930, partial [Candidatus Saccharibacteria bacterium]|nr:hypothetical protein [Candidatus Saccharibacteria bacterium]